MTTIKQNIVITLSILLFMMSGCAVEDTKQKSEEAKVLSYFKEDQCYKYHYEQLNKKEKRVYEQVYMHFDKGDTKFKTDYVEKKQADQIIEYVLNDHPEFYHIDMMSETRSYEELEFAVVYNQSKEDRKSIDAQLNERLAEVKMLINDEMSDFDKAKIVYDYIINRVDYVEGSEHNQNIISSLINDKSVCAGYARAYQYILTKLGVPTTYITGEAYEVIVGSDASHAWNMVQIEDDYYYVDTTWGDNQEIEIPHPLYGYFMMSQEEMKKLYKPKIKTMPTKKYDNYFMRTNTYLDTYNENMIIQAIVDANINNTKIVALKINPDIYTSTVNRLFNNNGEGIASMFEKAGIYLIKIQYYQNKKISVIEIIF